MASAGFYNLAHTTFKYEIEANIVGKMQKLVNKSPKPKQIIEKAVINIWAANVTSYNVYAPSKYK